MRGGEGKERTRKKKAGEIGTGREVQGIEAGREIEGEQGK